MNDKREGYGVCESENWIYEGEFSGDIMHGEGIATI